MYNSVDRVEVFAGIQRRRRYTAEQKMSVVHEAMQSGMTIGGDDFLCSSPSWYSPQSDLRFEASYERRGQRGDQGGR